MPSVIALAVLPLPFQVNASAGAERGDEALAEDRAAARRLEHVDASPGWPTRRANAKRSAGRCADRATAAERNPAASRSAVGLRRRLPATSAAFAAAGLSQVRRFSPRSTDHLLRGEDRAADLAGQRPRLRACRP